LSAREELLVLEIVHELLNANILMPAMNRNNVGWPWLGLTEHGRELLKQSGPPVYDYDRYLAELKQRVPFLDPVVERYLGESLRTYQSNAYYAAMAMLGCASERAIRLLIEAYLGAIDDTTNREKLRSRINRRDVSTAYEEFRKSFDST